jgi:hypothetical protein
MHRFLALPLCLTVMTAPAFASTLPRVDFKQGQLAVAAGAFDANVDYAVLNNLSIGVSGTFPWSLMLGAGRLTYRIGEVGPVSYGLSLSGGTIRPGLVNLQRPEDGDMGYWVQPALNLAVPLGSLPLTLRATVGPVWVNQTLTKLNGDIIPNAELAWRLNPSNELTLGGNALIGWRGTFGGK